MNANDFNIISYELVNIGISTCFLLHYSLSLIFMVFVGWIVRKLLITLVWNDFEENDFFVG